MDYFGINREGVCTGRVTLIPADVSVVDSVLKCSNGRTIVGYSDIEKAQKLDLEEKTKWFHETLQRYCSEVGGQGVRRINLRQKHMVDDSIKAVMSFSQSDLRKEWLLEREKELGQLSSKEWYTTVIGEIFSPDAGL